MFNVLVPISKKKTVKALLKLERDDFDLISLGREFQNLVVDTEKERPPSVSLVKRGQTLMLGLPLQEGQRSPVFTIRYGSPSARVTPTRRAKMTCVLSKMFQLRVKHSFFNMISSM